MLGFLESSALSAVLRDGGTVGHTQQSCRVCFSVRFGPLGLRLLLFSALFLTHQILPVSGAERLRLIIETDAGGDPDDEQSLVRFLLYANEWDIEGLIANGRSPGAIRARHRPRHRAPTGGRLRSVLDESRAT